MSTSVLGEQQSRGSGLGLDWSSNKYRYISGSAGQKLSRTLGGTCMSLYARDDDSDPYC